MNYARICIAARLSLGDLREADRQLIAHQEVDGRWMLLVKQCLVALANLTDLERTITPIYKTNPEVSTAFKAHAKSFEFAKYVRNIVVGHTNESLLEKALEWKPELNWFLADDRDMATLVTNLFVLETAMNTYVDEQERHLIFGGDTDLLYPPDWDRFVNWLQQVVHGGIAFLESAVAACFSLMPAG